MRRSEPPPACARCLHLQRRAAPRPGEPAWVCARASPLFGRLREPWRCIHYADLEAVIA